MKQKQNNQRSRFSLWGHVRFQSALGFRQEGGVNKRPPAFFFHGTDLTFFRQDGGRFLGEEKY